jgi:hypothetical protein
MTKFSKSLRILILIGAGAHTFSVHSSSPSRPQDPDSRLGGIVGRVIDSTGRQIINVVVFADAGGPSVTPPQTRTDRNGQFKFVGLRPGVYTLRTRKEDEGYPRSELNFYQVGVDTDPQVQVLANVITPNVLIQPQKGALLKGHVVDVFTGKPVEHMEVWVRQVADPERYLRVGAHNGDFQIVVPTVAFTVVIKATGYQDWHYRMLEYDGQDAPLMLTARVVSGIERDDDPTKRQRLEVRG